MTSPTGVASTDAAAYLALGDSYTIGEGVAPDGRWPVQLAAGLQRAGVAIAPPRIVATTGWTTDELDAGIDAAHAEAPIGTGHALVSLLIGVNNQYRGLPVDDYARQFDALLRRAAGFAGGDATRVLVLAIPDWGVTPFATAQSRDPSLVAAQLDQFNAAARAITERVGAFWIDIAPVSRLRGAEATMLVEDGLHPSADMYALWAALALPAARSILCK